jgi:hypothetical protein
MYIHAKEKLSNATGGQHLGHSHFTNYVSSNLISSTDFSVNNDQSSSHLSSASLLSSSAISSEMQTKLTYLSLLLDIGQQEFLRSQSGTKHATIHSQNHQNHQGEEMKKEEMELDGLIQMMLEKDMIDQEV